MIVEFTLCLLTVSHFGMFLAGIKHSTPFRFYTSNDISIAALPLKLKFQPILPLTVHIYYCHPHSADTLTALITFQLSFISLNISTAFISCFKIRTDFISYSLAITFLLFFKKNLLHFN